MAYSRLTKVVGGIVGTGILGLGCYHSARRAQKHVNEQQDSEKSEMKQSGTPGIGFSSAYFQRTIEVGLTAARFGYDLYEKFFRELAEIPDQEEYNVAVQNQAANQIPRYDPGAGGDAGGNAPLPARREEDGGGDAPQLAQPLAILGEGAPPPF